jgi:hypothetical protein
MALPPKLAETVDRFPSHMYGGKKQAQEDGDNPQYHHQLE